MFGSAVSLFLTIALGLIAVPVLLTAVNIAQNYLGAGSARTLDELLGKRAATATSEDLAGLNKAQLRRVFAAATAPAPGVLTGEFRARLLAGGVLGPASRLYTHRAFGPGRWVGKGFPPAEQAQVGYNLFERDGATSRVREMSLVTGPSRIVSGTSLLVNYGPHNSGTVATMRDELRQINDRLFIGMGYMAIGGGSINPAPFALEGPPSAWVGADAA